MKPRRVVLLHGWRVANPLDSIGILAQHFEDLGYETWVPDLGYLRWLWTRRKSELVARDLENDIREDDAFVAHSNGCYVYWFLSGYCIPTHRAVLINPALETHMEPGHSCEAARVTWNRKDLAVKLGSRVPFSSWGRMGCEGYQPRPGWPPDERILNHEYGQGHSPYRRYPQHFARGCDLFFRLPLPALRDAVSRQWSSA